MLITVLYCLELSKKILIIYIEPNIWLIRCLGLFLAFCVCFHFGLFPNSTFTYDANVLADQHEPNQHQPIGRTYKAATQSGILMSSLGVLPPKTHVKDKLVCTGELTGPPLQVSTKQR